MEPGTLGLEGRDHNWKCDSEDFFERKLVLVSQELFWKKAYSPSFSSLFKEKILQKRVWSWIYFVAYSWFDTNWVSWLVSRTHRNGKGFLPLIANMLVVSIIFFAEEGFVDSSCCVIFGLNKLACVDSNWHPASSFHKDDRKSCSSWQIIDWKL